MLNGRSTSTTPTDDDTKSLVEYGFVGTDTDTENTASEDGRKENNTSRMSDASDAHKLAPIPLHDGSDNDSVILDRARTPVKEPTESEVLKRPKSAMACLEHYKDEEKGIGNPKDPHNTSIDGPGAASLLPA